MHSHRFGISDDIMLEINPSSFSAWNKYPLWFNIDLQWDGPMGDSQSTISQDKN